MEINVKEMLATRQSGNASEVNANIRILDLFVEVNGKSCSKLASQSRFM